MSAPASETLSEIAFSRFLSVRNTTPHARALPWERFVDELRKAKPARCTLATCGTDEHAYYVDGEYKGCREKYIAAWSPAIYPAGLTRADANVSELSLLVVDADHLDDAQLAATFAQLEPYRYVAHSSHSDCPEDRCVRISLALSRPATAAEWPRLWRGAMSMLAMPADRTCVNRDRLYFYPSRPSDAEYLFVEHEGEPLDVDAILAATPEEPEEPKPPKTRSKTSAGDSVFDELARLDQGYVLTQISSTWLVNGEAITLGKSVRAGASKGNRSIIIDGKATSGFIDSEGRIAHKKTAGAKDGGPLASTWCRFYNHTDARIRAGLVEFVPELRAFEEARKKKLEEERNQRTDRQQPHNLANPGDDVESETARGFDSSTPIDAESDFFDEAPPPTDGDVPPKRKLFENDPRPEIILSTDRPSVIDAAERALAWLGGVYVRGRQLVKIVRDRGATEWLSRPTGTPVIVPIERDGLLDLLGRAAIWIVFKDDAGKKTAAPSWVAAMLMARAEWNLPQLEAIADSPVFCADGSVQTTPGYDPSTRVIFDPCGVEFPEVPGEPSRDDARKALAALQEPFSEFPFVANCDRSATAALVLSVIGRAAIDGCVPMFSSQAPTPGSGKGLLIDAASIIATGRKSPLMAPTEDDDETRKRLLAIAIESPSMIVIDNVEGAIGSPALAMALTAGEVRDRVLGSTKIITATLRPVWSLTGNNIQLKGDLGRRVVPIDLDPKVEHPEDRSFERGELLTYVRANRPRFVVAALTVLRAYVLAGKPPHGKPAKGSFESWDRLIRGAVIWAGGEDPLGGVQRIRDAADEDLDRLRALLVSWSDLLGGASVTIAEAVRRAGETGTLHDSLAAYCRSGKLETRQLGYAFRKVRGRVVSGLCLERVDADRDGIALWQVATPRQGGCG